MIRRWSIAAAFGLALVAGFMWVGKMKKQREIVIALQGEIPKGNLSPENISTIPLFHLHYNLWDTLVTENKEAAIADSFAISPDETTYTFDISPAAKFSNGREITAEDVKASLERLISREENGHINAKSTIQSIAANGGRLVIKLFEPTPSFLFLLGSPEFGIVPREALDEKGNVANLHVTSGAYSLDSIDFTKQGANLIQNPYFRRLRKDSPEKVELRFLKAADLAGFRSMLGERQFDFIEVQNSDADSFLPIVEGAGYAFHKTLPSFSVFLVANSSLPLPVAQTIAKAFRDNFRFGSTDGIERPSVQLFPPKTFGALAPEEIPSILAPHLTSPLPRSVKIRALRSTGAMADEIRRVFSLLGVSVTYVPWSDETYDYWFLGQGMNSEYPEIELHLQMLSPYAVIDVDEKTKQLLRSATHSTGDAARAAAIKEIGKKLLASGKVVPLTVRSYLHVNSKRLDTSETANYDGNIPIYRLQVLE